MADPIAAAGLAASVLQLADVGARLSIKLFTVGKQIKNASRTYETISQEVSLTTSVLHQLGKNLRDDSQDAIHNEASLKIVSALTKECDTVFTDLRAAVTTEIKPGATSAAKRWSKWSHCLALPYREKDMEASRSKLENVKSLLNIILTSLTLASQVKGSKSR